MLYLPYGPYDGTAASGTSGQSKGEIKRRGQTEKERKRERGEITRTEQDPPPKHPPLYWPAGYPFITHRSHLPQLRPLSFQNLWAGWDGGINYMITAQGLLSSCTSAQTPPGRKEPLYLENIDCTCIHWAQEPPFPEITSTLLFPRIRLLAAQPSQSHYEKILLLRVKHIAKAQPHLPEPDSKQSLFQALSLLPSVCCTIWSSGVPLWGDRKEDKPTLPKGCNFLQSSGLQQAVVGGILGN